MFPQIRRVECRAKIWGSHAPSALAKGDCDQGRILSCLLNIPHSNPVAPTATSNLEFAHNVSGVNSEQALTVDGFLNPIGGLVLQNAGGGCGETYGIFIAVPALLDSLPEAQIIMTTHSNAGVSELVLECLPALEDRYQPLVLVSAMAKEDYHYLFEPYQKHMLFATVDVVLDENKKGNRVIENSSVKRLERYSQDYANRPKMTAEIPTLNTLVQQGVKLPRIVFVSVSLLEDCPLLLESATHLVLDEAGQSTTNLLIPLVIRMPKIRKIVLTGDPKQLPNYTGDVPKVIQRFGFNSLLTYLPKLTVHPPFTVQLRKSYRFHPELAECLAETIYGSDLVPAVTAQQRDMLTRCLEIPLPNRKVPILLLHRIDEDRR